MKTSINDLDLIKKAVIICWNIRKKNLKSFAIKF